MIETPRFVTLCAAITLGLVGCAGEAEEEEMPDDEVAEVISVASVTIDTPAEGATVDGSSVEVTLSVEGAEVAAVADGRAGTVHHHLFLDVDLTPLDEMVPLDNPMIIHMGDGRTTHTFEGLEAGEHRVIAVLADPAHVPLSPAAVDTVTFTVAN